MSALDGVKEGDPVALYEWGALICRYAGRTTKTRVSVGERQFMRSTGREVGCSFRSSTRLEAWTQDHTNELAERAAELTLRKAQHKLESFQWRRITQKQADAVIGVMCAAGMLDAADQDTTQTQSEGSA
jgi:hypothetical protein